MASSTLPTDRQCDASVMLSKKLTDAEIAAMNFWCKSPELWLSHAEAFFVRREIHDDEWKYHFVRQSSENAGIYNASVCQPTYEEASRILALLKTLQREIEYCFDRRELLTMGAVKRLASGDWDGKPFVVQVIDMPPDDESLVLKDLEHVFVTITDGVYRCIVKTSRKMLPIIRAHQGQQDFPIIKVEGCDYHCLPETKLLLEMPCKLQRQLSRRVCRFEGGMEIME